MASVAGPRITERGEYLKRVLAPAAKDGVTPDLFTRYALDVNEDGHTVITEQITFAVKLWRNDKDHPKYGELVRRLLKEHADAERVLTDPARRRAARAEILRSRESQDRARYREFETLIVELRDRGGMLPLSTRKQLEEVGHELGLTGDEIARRLDAERFLDDIGADRAALDAARYKAVVEQLTSLRRAVHADEVGPTLLSFIKAPFSASRQHVTDLYRRAMEENAKRPYGNEKTLESGVLVDVRRYLVEGDPDLYRNAVVGDVKDSLRERVQRRKRLHDRLDENPFQSLVADAVRRGLDEKWANTAIRELAREERLAIAGEGEEPAPGPPRQAPVPPARPGAPPPPRPPGIPPPRQPSLHDYATLPMRLWFLPAFIPMLGPVLSWTYAARKTGNRRYRAWSYLYAFLFTVALVSSLGSSSSSGGTGVLDTLVALLWIFGPMVQAIRRRKEVTMAMAARRAGR